MSWAGVPESETPRPYVRISPNDRVVLADHATGRQLDFLGQIRRDGGARRFVLAIRANGFFAEVAADRASSLGDLDGVQLTADFGEDRLAADIGSRLGIA